MAGQANGAARLPELLPQLQAATAGLAFSRAGFAAFFDGWLAERRRPGAPAGFLHALVTAQEAAPEADPAEDAEALALALAALGDPVDILTCISAAVGGGVFDGADAAPGRLPQARAAVMAPFLKALGDRATFAELQRGEFQLMTSADTIWTDPGLLLPALFLARRRLCVIISRDQDERPVQGTGFLIGPSAVLTNLHVVEHWPATLADPAEVEVRFDYSPTTGLEEAEASAYRPAADWCIAQSPVGTKGPEGATAAWWKDKARRDGWLAQVAATLDYAVIRLAAAPGLQRGWYDLSAAPPARQNATCRVLHHPSGTYHTVTEGRLYYARPGTPRIFHSASTVHGSSGGLLLDHEGAPIGLHHLGLSTEPPSTPLTELRAPDTVINCAVSLAAIAADLGGKGVLGPIGQSGRLAPFRGCLDGIRPVFGREGLLHDLAPVYSGERPILSIHVGDEAARIAKPGKSFTIDLIRALFREPEHHHVVFKAGKIDVDALRMARAILRSFAPDLVPTLPAAPDTTTAAYAGRLVGLLAAAIRDRMGNRMLWLMIDDLEKHSLSDASGREFLATLYNRIGTIPNLRIVLVGLDRNIAIGGLDPQKVQQSFILDTDVRDVTQLFSDWLDARGAREHPMDDRSRRLLGGIVAAYAGTDRPLAMMAEFAATYMPAVLDSAFGRAGPEDGP